MHIHLYLGRSGSSDGNSTPKKKSQAACAQKGKERKKKKDLGLLPAFGEEGRGCAPPHSASCAFPQPCKGGQFAARIYQLLHDAKRNILYLLKQMIIEEKS